MPILLSISCAIFILFYNIYESSAAVYKYSSFDSDNTLEVINVTNLFNIISRIFISLAAIALSIIIESGFSELYIIISIVSGYFLSIVFLAFGAPPKINQSAQNSSIFNLLKSPFLRRESQSFYQIKFDIIFVILIFFQVCVPVMVYLLCMQYPENRLIIISLSPAISMFGTATTILLVEPKLSLQVMSAKLCRAEVVFLLRDQRKIAYCIAIVLTILSLVDI